MVKTDAAESAAKFSKEQLLKSRRYANRRDLLGALLSDEKRYTLKEVDAAIKTFMKGKVQ